MGFDYSLQPYVGCEYNCTYCYVRAMPVQRMNPYGLSWSKWISPKENAAKLLWDAGKRGKLANARIFFSSATDPYTPIERKLQITRACLEVFATYPAGLLLLQTRSPWVTRDIDLLKKVQNLIVSMTITTDDEKVRKLCEPNSASLTLRRTALQQLRDNEICTQVSVSPILPCDPGRLAKQLDQCADRVVLDDFFCGDGAGGKRSRPTLERLRKAGYSDWAKPGSIEKLRPHFERVLGKSRVGLSQQGFSDFAAYRRILQKLE